VAALLVFKFFYITLNTPAVGLALSGL